MSIATEPGSPASLRRAKAATRSAARSFAPALRFFPAAIRGDVYSLYLVMRTLDDLVDSDHPEAARRIDAVRAWAAGGPARGPEPGVLAYLHARHPQLPTGAVADFCRGMARDLAGFTVETEEDLDDYAYQVAGTVGCLVAAMLGSDGSAADGYARALGIAMQRTNVLRDIDEDLAAGRVYLPRATLQASGVRDLARDDRAALLRYEIALADAWYDWGLAGLHLLHCGARPVRAAAAMYREILRQIERDGLGVTRPARAIVPRGRKAWVGVHGHVKVLTGGQEKSPPLV